VALYRSGLSIGKVAERMGVSRQGMHDLLKRRIKLRDRIEALPRKESTATRRKRAKARKRYRERAARITAAQIRAVRERDQACVTCGAPGTDIDHITPVSEGGQTEMGNLQLLCHSCHVEKSRADWKTRERWKEVA
jgi:5-methylcytosine-specific restriction endonuclease McrA